MRLVEHCVDDVELEVEERGGGGGGAGRLSQARASETINYSWRVSEYEGGSKVRVPVTNPW